MELLYHLANPLAIIIFVEMYWLSCNQFQILNSYKRYKVMKQETEVRQYLKSRPHFSACYLRGQWKERIINTYKALIAFINQLW